MFRPIVSSKTAKRLHMLENGNIEAMSDPTKRFVLYKACNGDFYIYDKRINRLDLFDEDVNFAEYSLNDMYEAKNPTLEEAIKRVEWKNYPVYHVKSLVHPKRIVWTPLRHS